MTEVESHRRRFRAEVRWSVGLLFAMVTEALARATSALLDQDIDLAEEVIEEDHAIDRRCGELTAVLKEGLAAAAGDPEELQTLVDLLLLVPELERSADLAEHIARRTRQGLGGVIDARSRGLIQSMSDVALEMWQRVAQAYDERSADGAVDVAGADHRLDELSARLVSQGEGAEPRIAADLALIARFYERLGDHAVNIARRVDSMAPPRRPPSSGPEGSPKGL